MKQSILATELARLNKDVELRLPFSNANRVLVRRASQISGVEVSTRTADGWLYVRLKGLMNPTTGLATEVVPIGESASDFTHTPLRVNPTVQGEQAVVTDPNVFVLWATKLGEPVPVDVLEQLPPTELEKRIERGMFRKVFSHPLILTGRNDAKYLNPPKTAE